MDGLASMPAVSHLVRTATPSLCGPKDRDVRTVRSGTGGIYTVRPAMTASYNSERPWPLTPDRLDQLDQLESPAFTPPVQHSHAHHPPNTQSATICQMQAISPQYQDLTCFTCSQPCRVFDGLDLSFLPPLLCSVAVDLWPPTNNMLEQFVRSGHPSALTAEAENSFVPGVGR